MTLLSSVLALPLAAAEEDTGGPGIIGFAAFFALAVILWALMRNMNARMRRMSYRQTAAGRAKDEPQVGPEESGEREGGSGN